MCLQMGRNLFWARNRYSSNHQWQQVRNIRLNKPTIQLKQKHHHQRTLCNYLERTGTRVELPRPGRPQIRQTLIRSRRRIHRLHIFPTSRPVFEEMANSELKVLVNLANEVQKGLNLGLYSWPEVPEEVEDYADTNQAVLFVVRGEHLHSDF